MFISDNILPTNCQLCPRCCGVNRDMGETGLCGANNKLLVARAALHFWEEPPISGEAGSGTVFFSNCSLRCVYCQNYNIAHGNHGKAITVERLAEIFLELQNQGALNINLVSPTHYVPQIKAALDEARSQGLNLPIVYNTSGYERPQTIKSLEGYVDVYLTDFKYSSSQVAQRYSRAEDYPQVARDALASMFEQVGPYREDAQGILEKGIIARHLLLPGCLDGAKQIVKMLYETYGDDVCISLMNQYTPLKTLPTQFSELARKVSDEEYDELIDYALDLGVTNSFMQDGDAASESFIPDFDCTGV